MFTLTFQISKVKQEYDQLQQMKLEKVFSTYVEKRLSSEDKVVLYFVVMVIVQTNERTQAIVERVKTSA